VYNLEKPLIKNKKALKVRKELFYSKQKGGIDDDSKDYSRIYKFLNGVCLTHS